MKCFRFLKVFSILVVAFFVLSLTSVSSSAEFYAEDSQWLLDTLGIYGGYFVVLESDSIYEVTDYSDSLMVIWIPANYKDNFSSDSYDLVNISSSTITCRAYTLDGTYYQARFQGFGKLQIRRNNTPLNWITIEYCTIVDMNIHIMGEDSPIYNSNLALSYDTKFLIIFLFFDTLILLFGVIKKNDSFSR